MPIIRELVKIDLPNGEYARVKKKLSKGDQIAVQQAVVRSAKVGLNGADSELVDPAAAIEAAVFATAELAVKTLGLRIDDGELQEMPSSPALLREMDAESYDALAAALDELYPARRSETTTANLSANGAASPSASRHLQKTSPG